MFRGMNPRWRLIRRPCLKNQGASSSMSSTVTSSLDRGPIHAFIGISLSQSLTDEAGFVSFESSPVCLIAFSGRQCWPWATRFSSRSLHRACDRTWGRFRPRAHHRHASHDLPTHHWTERHRQETEFQTVPSAVFPPRERQRRRRRREHCWRMLDKRGGHRSIPYTKNLCC